MIQTELECGPMTNVMAALLSIGGALCSTAQSLADNHFLRYTNTLTYLLTRVLCSNVAKTRNPLKLAGVPQTPEPFSAVSGLKFTIL